jgi:hypothetical protein
MENLQFFTYTSDVQNKYIDIFKNFIKDWNKVNNLPILGAKIAQEYGTNKIGCQVKVRYVNGIPMYYMVFEYLTPKKATNNYYPYWVLTVTENEANMQHKYDFDRSQYMITSAVITIYDIMTKKYKQELNYNGFMLNKDYFFKSQFSKLGYDL